MYVFMYACLSVCLYVCVYMCMCIYVRTYTCTYVCMCVSMHVCVHGCMDVCTYACMRACTSARMYGCMDVWMLCALSCSDDRGLQLTQSISNFFMFSCVCIIDAEPTVLSPGSSSTCSGIHARHPGRKAQSKNILANNSSIRSRNNNTLIYDI